MLWFFHLRSRCLLCKEQVSHQRIRFVRLRQEYNHKKLGFWIISIVKNEALMILRRKQKELPQEDWDTFSADVSDPTSYNELVHLFSQLPPTYRSALEMRLINGYSGKEIAQHLGISESAVNTRISRGRTLLREIAVKEGFHI